LSADHNQLRHALAEQWGETFGKPVVHDELCTRSLCFDAFSIQSSMRRSGPLELDLAYTRAMMSFQLFQHDPKDILIVGLGGESLSKYCFYKFPSARVTTVEIDERVLAVRDRFFNPPDSEKIPDRERRRARVPLGQSWRRGCDPARRLRRVWLARQPVEPVFYDFCYRALRNNGVLVANLLNNDPQLTTHLGRIRDACNGKLFRTIARCEGNTIAIGVKQANVRGWLDSTPVRKPSRHRWELTCTGMSKKWNTTTR